jgi:hypothetical protein
MEQVQREKLEMPKWAALAMHFDELYMQVRARGKESFVIAGCGRKHRGKKI